ncbi:IS5/IS1182 family transposase [Metallosphaera sedula]|uniref:IS5/IS1182 family transposase n=1 Tax=Metallosphaera sedula TaxID=43687 RepID=UPI0020BD940C|nr:IS5/IS1182 family transposase [Metallosphaera sedula]BBL46961.1 IS5/IS1182 family transposase [Metallosphaera sedula]
MKPESIQQPQYVVMPVPPLEDMPSKDKTLFLLQPVVEMVRPRVEEKLPGSFTYFKLLVVMIVYCCSLRDAVNLVNTNVVVRLFVGERVGKSTLFDFIGRFARARKDLLREIAKELEAKCRQSYLPSSALYEGIEWLVDSFLLDLPPGKTSLELVLEKLRLDAMDLGPIARVIAFARAWLRARTRRRFEGTWAKKWSRSYFGLKVFPLISTALFVHGLEVEMANFSDVRCRLSRKGLKLVDRGFRERGTFVHPHGNFKYLRPFVEYFGIFLKQHWRPYAETKVRNEAFLYAIAITYNMVHFVSIQRRTPRHLRAVQLP